MVFWRPLTLVSISSVFCLIGSNSSLILAWAWFPACLSNWFCLSVPMMGIWPVWMYRRRMINAMPRVVPDASIIPTIDYSLIMYQTVPEFVPYITPD